MTFFEKAKILTDLFSDQFPIKGVIEIKIEKIDQIIAPSYYLFSNTTGEKQIEAAMKTYKVKPLDKA